MKKSVECGDVCGLEKGRSKLGELWAKQVDKARHGKFTCPICKEAFTGLSAMGSHLKDHCT